MERRTNASGTPGTVPREFVLDDAEDALVRPQFVSRAVVEPDD
jgi:hypothetical protein